MPDLAHLETDDALENDGVETELPNLPGAKVWLIGTGSRAFEAAQFAVARELRLADVPEDQRETESRVRLAARLTGRWEGITDHGAEFPFTYENACALYRRLPRVRVDALRFIAQPANYRPPAYDLRTDEAAAGNSAPSSPGA